MTGTQSVVEAETTLLLVVPKGPPLPLPATLRYDRSDPVAVHLLLGVDETEPVVWCVARDLLAAGLDEPAGVGDVRVWPTPDGGFVAVALSSPEGRCLFQVRRSALVWFLNRTYRMVRRGAESEHLDVDTAIAALLGAR